MKRPTIVAAVVAALAALAPLAVAAAPGYAATSSANAPTVNEAWYASSQCTLPTGCGALGRQAPASPYPADTLHVGVVGGTETDRTYLSFDLTSIAMDASLTGGTLTVPLDTAPTDGSQSANSAHVDACPMSAPFRSVQGSFAKPPPATCTVRAPASYADTGGPARLVVDLSPLVSQWSRSSAALALVPSQAAVDGHESWHVVFSARTRANPPSPPASALMKYSVAGPAEPDATNEEPAAINAPPITNGPLFSPPVVLEPERAALPEVVATPPAAIAFASPAPAEPAAPVSEQPAALVSSTGPRPYQYPLVWLAPLALLAGVAAIGRAFTRDLR